MRKHSVMPHYLRTDEHQEAISALEMVAESIAMIRSDIYRWKWVILALHNALQGFMVLVLRGGNGFLAMRDEVAAAWLKAHREKLPYPEEKLDGFLNLYEKVKSNRMKFYVHSCPLKPQGTQGRSVKMLNSLRNEFIHFVPKGWSLEVSGMPDICIDCLDIIDFLGWKCGNIFWIEPALKDRAKNALLKARNLAKEIRSDYLKRDAMITPTD